MNKLTQLPIPELSEKQLQIFNTEPILSEKAYELNINQTLTKLKDKAGTRILTFDIGGTAIKANILKLNPDLTFILEKDLGQTKSIEKGENYLDFLLKQTQENPDLIIGVSADGTIEKDNIPNAINLPNFVSKLKNKGGFSKIFNNRKFVVLNDSVALAIAGFFVAVRKYPDIKQIIVIINGGGIGGAVVNNQGEVFASEPGHLSVTDRLLNPYEVKTPCEFLGRKEVCLEKIGAVGAGIEAQWQLLKHEKLSGEEINRLIITDETALNLFANSALVTSHVIEGLRKSYDFLIENTAIICHGGCFKAEEYTERVKQILAKHYRSKSFLLLTTQQLGFNNACMTGAAIAALSTDLSCEALAK